MIPLNIETILGTMPVKANSRVQSPVRVALMNHIKSNSVEPFLTQYSNGSRMRQDILEDIYSVNYGKSTAEQIAEKTKEFDANYTVKSYKLNNEQAKELWAKVKDDVEPKDFIELQFNKKGNVYPVFVIQRKS